MSFGIVSALNKKGLWKKYGLFAIIISLVCAACGLVEGVLCGVREFVLPTEWHRTGKLVEASTHCAARISDLAISSAKILAYGNHAAVEGTASEKNKTAADFGIKLVERGSEIVAHIKIQELYNLVAKKTAWAERHLERVLDIKRLACEGGFSKSSFVNVGRSIGAFIDDITSTDVTSRLISSVTERFFAVPVHN